MRRQFLRSVLPAVLAFALSGVYAIVDGFFIGNRMGDAGLAAISIAYPITALLQAVGTGIGMGGAVLFSICGGKGDGEGQRRFLGGTLLGLLLSCVVVTGLFLLSAKWVLSLLGAEGELLTLSFAYIQVILYGAFFQIFGTGLVPLIRNAGGAYTAMAAMIAGFLTNILLDYLFVWVFPYGMAGAAAATVIGQAVTMAICTGFLLKKRLVRQLKLGGAPLATLAVIFKTGLSPFGLTFSPNLTLMLMNKGAVLYGGELAVACYSVIAYLTAIVQLLLQGVGDGSQPLVSRLYGEEDGPAVKRVRGMAYQCAIAIALLCTAVLFLLRGTLPALFGPSEEAAGMIAEVLAFFVAGFVLVGFVRITTAYFYATGKNLEAVLLIAAEPALLLLLLCVVPRFFQLNGVWASVPIMQILMVALGGGLLWRTEGSRPGRRMPAK